MRLLKMTWKKNSQGKFFIAFLSSINNVFNFRFGKVSKVEIKSKKDIDGHVAQIFAFIDLQCDSGSLSRCISAMGNKE